MSEAPLRLGILSTARIARHFVAGVRPSRRVQITAVASRDAQKARAFATDLGIARPIDSYEALLADPHVDAVYIALPNSLHAEWSIRALQAGKHVLCEKPLAVNAAEARGMFDAARLHRRCLAEAFPYLAQPQTRKLRELVTAGTLGELRLIQASFGFTLTDASNIRFDAKLAGGALMDAGTYPVSLVRVLAGTRPTRVQAAAHFGATGVDRSLAATLEFSSGLLAQITCSFDSAPNRHAVIVGAAGVIQTTYLNHTSVDQPGSLQLQMGQGADSVIDTAPANGFLAEAEAFERWVRGGAPQWSGASAEESIDIATLLEALLKSARTRQAVEIP